jgi:hypothetical protein
MLSSKRKKLNISVLTVRFKLLRKVTLHARSYTQNFLSAVLFTNAEFRTFPTYRYSYGFRQGSDKFVTPTRNEFCMVPYEFDILLNTVSSR